MDVAYTAWDLQALSDGRFALGLGSQVRAHIERRYGAVWSSPAARMREYVLALRAIWDAWESGGELDFRGEFYSHTLMPPNFRPAPAGQPRPPVLLAGVRERMTEVAGEVADGFLGHAFCTAEVLREVTLPALERGLERGGRARGDLEITASVFVATSDEEWEACRRRVAFYGSTPGYRHVLDHHGLGTLFETLYEKSKSGAWVEMPALVDDDVLALFVARGRRPGGGGGGHPRARRRRRRPRRAGHRGDGPRRPRAGRGSAAAGARLARRRSGWPRQRRLRVAPRTPSMNATSCSHSAGSAISSTFSAFISPECERLKLPTKATSSATVTLACM